MAISKALDPLAHRDAIQTVVHALKHSVMDVLQKPFRVEILLKRVKQAVKEEGDEGTVR